MLFLPLICNPENKHKCCYYISATKRATIPTITPRLLELVLLLLLLLPSLILQLILLLQDKVVDNRPGYLFHIRLDFFLASPGKQKGFDILSPYKAVKENISANSCLLKHLADKEQQQNLIRIVSPVT